MEDNVPRIRFDIAIRNAIRDQPQKGDAASAKGPDLIAQPPRPQQPTPRVLKRAARRLLRPFKPAAYYLRSFLLAPLEANIGAARVSIDALRASNETLRARSDHLANQNLELGRQLRDLAQTTQAALRDLAQMTQAAQSLQTTLVAKAEEIALRSRGALALDDATLALRTYDGFVLVPREDALLLLMLLDAGPHGLEPGTRRVICKLLSPGMTFVDIGAHIGLLTLAGARAVGSSGKVLAIEPTPRSFELLTRGLAANALLSRVVLKAQAVGARRDHCRFFVADVLGHSSLTRPESPEEKFREIDVDVSPLDDLVPPGTSVDLVKIDVEGAELAVLAGMTRIIRENPDVAIIAEFGPSHLKANGITSEQWFSAFRNHGFEGYTIDELSAKCHRAKLTELANVESVNVLFARQDSSMLGRALR
jgi:FkbM family methyltransferase